MQLNPIEVQKHLKGVDYPASRQALIDAAESNGAPDEVMDGLRKLDDSEYQTPAEVMKNLNRSGA